MRTSLESLKKFRQYYDYANLHKVGSSRPDVFWKKLFLEIFQNSQENACTRVSILIKLQGGGLELY